MEGASAGKRFLENFAEYLTGLLTSLLERLFGPDMQTALYEQITWARLMAGLCFLVLVLVLNGLGALLVRRQSRALPEGEAAPGWKTPLLGAVSKPVYLVLWVCGLYFAVTPILAGLPSVEEVHPLRRLCDRLFDLGVFVAVFWLFFRLTRVLEGRLKLWAAQSESRVDDLLVPLVGRSLRVILPVIAIILALPVMGLPPTYSGVLGKASSLLIIVVISWILFQAVGLAEKVIMSKYDLSVADNLRARQVYTQVTVLKKTLYVVIAIFTMASVLMLFEEVRRLGTSILASAGVLGIILGFAAQRTIANLFAGFQLALTQPIRIDDVVIVENEWGRIEEITLTYVVIRIWDLRRLIVPISHFIERPFQNWTRVSADLLGSVIIHADYTLPVDPLRREVQRIIEGCPDWDRKFWNLQVTDASDRSVQLRVLATSADASKGWNLRCEIREKLIRFLQEHYPQCLPKARVELAPPALTNPGAPA